MDDVDNFYHRELNNQKLPNKKKIQKTRKIQKIQKIQKMKKALKNNVATIAPVQKNGNQLENIASNDKKITLKKKNLLNKKTYQRQSYLQHILSSLW